MHFQKHEHYALLFMAELARKNGVEPLPLAAISRQHGVSLAFLKKIVRSLRATGLVQSKEGFGGGYILARQPESISIWEILSSFEVMHDEKPKSVVCPLNTSCLPQHIRSIVSQTIQDRLEHISLKEAIE